MSRTIKNHFSIKDLENLSGIKAHTLRIWEKRYNLLQPERSDTNIRSYDISNLKRLLNVTILYNEGYKISKIAKLADNELVSAVQNIGRSKIENSVYFNDLKLAMINFDSVLFERTIEELSRQHDFGYIFKEILIPLLLNVGLDWQSSVITVSHEHFISYLVKQKLLCRIEEMMSNEVINTTTTYVLFLPQHEVHEFGLLYIHYELLARGYRCVYLGQNVPVESLRSVQEKFDDITFVSYLTVYPQVNDVPRFLSDFMKTILSNRPNDQLWVTGRQVTNQRGLGDLQQIKCFVDFERLLAQDELCNQSVTKT